MNLDDIKRQYEKVPNDLKALKRWVCFQVKEIDGKLNKYPINAINGKMAKVNDPITWNTFEIASYGCEKYKCDGLGFVLGAGIFGVDLDNHINPNTGKQEMDEKEFNLLCNEFLGKLDSYAEKSYSGLGIHIICKGKLPEGKRKSTCVEMYDWNRFFAFTGDTINSKNVENREEEIKELFNKYLPSETHTINNSVGEGNDLEIQEIIGKAKASKNGKLFSLLYEGDVAGAYAISNGWKDDSHSSADQCFCNLLAFWCNRDIDKMDTIFRSSGLMRDKWDENRGGETYGNLTLNQSIKFVTSGYEPKKELFNITINANSENDKMNIDKNGNPIFRIKKILKRYPNNDTGNAEKFYDYFGDLFKYNTTDKIFMFWTGKTWIRDEKDIIRKYANKLIEISKREIENLRKECQDKQEDGEDTKFLEEFIKAFQKNIDRISNKAGKDAMLYELKSIYDVATISSEFNENPLLLNTDSGVVNLETGVINDFDSKYMLSKNTNVKVSYETPTTWLNFLHSVFKRQNPAETEEIIECLQKCLGYSLSGLTSEQCMFLLYGNGSNGKSTFSEFIGSLLGDYGDTVNPDVLMQQKMQQNNSFTIAKLKDARFIQCGETDDGGKMAESQVKRLTGGDTLSAAFKYANEFSFKPKFKIWMSTNNRPIIKGTDYGIWRRIFPFPFLVTFKDEEKDRTLPYKLSLEADKVLGWCIQGFKKYKEAGWIEMPKCLKNELADYRDEMDPIAQFLKDQCEIDNYAIINLNEVFSRYKMWCVNNNEYVYGQRKFTMELQKKGITLAVINGKRCYKGIRLVGE